MSVSLATYLLNIIEHEHFCHMYCASLCCPSLSLSVSPSVWLGQTSQMVSTPPVTRARHMSSERRTSRQMFQLQKSK